MTIAVKCKKCNRGYKVRDDKTGKRFKCHKCGTSVLIPKPVDDEEDLWDDETGGDEYGDDDYGDGDEDGYEDSPARRPRKSRTARTGTKKNKAAKKKSGLSRVVFIVGGIAVGLIVVGSIIGAIFVFGGGDESGQSGEPGTIAGQNSSDAAKETNKPARKPSRRTRASLAETRDKLIKTGVAAHEYHSAFNRYPPYDSRTGGQYTPKNKNVFLDEDFKPILSWRVHLLRDLGEKALYDRFKLDEPWDSPNNKPLLDEMPDVYRFESGSTGNKTRFVGLVGPGTPFHKLVVYGGPRIRDISDGTSNTLFVVEVGTDKAIEWTKPEDANFDPQNPLEALGNSSAHFNFLFFDGSVRTLTLENLKTDTFKAIATHDGKEIFDHNQLK